MSDVLYSIGWYSMREAQWFILIAGLMMLWMTMVVVV